MNEYRDKKITKTSFLDDSFRKNLESALRFGNPLLVQVLEVFKFSSILFFIFIIIFFFYIYLYYTWEQFTFGCQETSKFYKYWQWTNNKISAGCKNIITHS
jgi:hypothetical protein